VDKTLKIKIREREEELEIVETFCAN